jgi:RDD domain containing protein
MDTGQRIDLTAASMVLLGRDPQAVAPWEGARTIAVDDPGFSISKTHVAVIVDGAGVLVEDLGSTNGTSVQTPDGALTRAGEGRRVRAGVGDVIHVGQRQLMVGH